jgi:hypothetical protein
VGWKDAPRPKQKTPPVAQALHLAFVHLEIGNPTQIMEPDVSADAATEQSAKFGGCGKFSFSGRTCFITVHED